MFIVLVLLPFVFQSCSNDEVIFADYDHQAVYFAYQSPVRTITFGEDFVNTDLDNQGRVQIMATLGGVYSNNNNVSINFVVDSTLLSGVRFADGRPILNMPANYFQLASNQMVIPSGRVVGGVMVQLTPAFFADPLAISTNFVIPIRMVSVAGADTILSGSALPNITNPRRLFPGDWAIQPRDYVLYAVRYVNPYHGFYLRRGTDAVNWVDPLRTDVNLVRRAANVESDQVILASTVSMNEVSLPITYRDAAGITVPATLMLTFNDQGNISVAAPVGAAYTATGSGRFIKDGERNSWGNQDRDVIHLQYQVNFPFMEVATTDTLVLRNRGVGMETFSVIPN